ncbi:MAG: hypothetical protein QW486_09075 [Candidatus Bathyarchaeia archaeon]
MGYSGFLRRDLPLIIITASAIPMLLYRYIEDPVLKEVYTQLGFWASIISMIAWGLGVVYLFQGEYHTLRRRPTLTQKLSFGALAGFSILLVTMAATLPGDLNNPSYLWVYYAFYRAQSTAYYGLMFLYLGSATYRMLRMRSLESSVLMISGLLYLFRNASLFQLYFPWLTPLGEWLMNYPNKAATTAAVMCMAFGSIVIAARQLLMRERTAVSVR